MNYKNILFLDPHCDDIILSASGLILRCPHAKKTWITFSYCENNLKNPFRKDNYIEEVNNLNSYFDIVAHYDFVNREFYKSRDEIHSILYELINNDYDLVILPSTFDIHYDHKVISEEGIRMFKNKCSILGFENAHNYLENNYDHYIKMNIDQMKTKKEMFYNFKSQIIKKDYIYSIDVVAAYRGLQIGCKYAEAFQTIRIIQ
jgi:N-acetylglucosamine malate deacetylase 1